MFVYELSGYWFKSRCSYLNFTFRACFITDHLRIFCCTAMKYLLNSYVNWILKFISLTDISLELIKAFFTVKELSCNLRNGHILNLLTARTTYYGTNSILFRACQVWNNLPLFIKQSQPLLEFKTNTKTLRHIECLCKICKI